jgi:hypothetical protein
MLVAQRIHVRRVAGREGVFLCQGGIAVGVPGKPQGKRLHVDHVIRREAPTRGDVGGIVTRGECERALRAVELCHERRSGVPGDGSAERREGLEIAVRERHSLIPAGHRAAQTLLCARDQVDHPLVALVGVLAERE